MEISLNSLQKVSPMMSSVPSSVTMTLTSSVCPLQVTLTAKSPHVFISVPVTPYRRDLVCWSWLFLSPIFITEGFLVWNLTLAMTSRLDHNQWHRYRKSPDKRCHLQNLTRYFVSWACHKLQLSIYTLSRNGLSSCKNCRWRVLQDMSHVSVFPCRTIDRASVECISVLIDCMVFDGPVCVYDVRFLDRFSRWYPPPLGGPWACVYIQCMSLSTMRNSEFSGNSD